MVKRTVRKFISRSQSMVHKAIEGNVDKSLTPFKTPVHILDRDSVRNRSRQTSFKTMGKSGKQNTSSQDTVRKVSENLIPFKTPDVRYRTSRVHFKTFEDWVKARKTKCDTVLKDVSSFVSEKEEDQQRSYPSRTAQQLVDKEKQ